MKDSKIMTELLPQASFVTVLGYMLKQEIGAFLIAWKVFWWDSRSAFGFTKIHNSIKGHNWNL